ncbi:MAG: sigma-70 family RNA polymerase sigma factor [Thermonemataceae bacterium]|nr:sigma-70 family RNA polymerase sigma factor [Thermonemataceae bacterium]
MTKDVTNIWTNFNKELKGFIYNKTRNSADTDDILQEVFVKIIRNIDKVNQSENLRQYLYGMVRNTLNDYFKNQKIFSDKTELQEQFSETEDNSLNETIAECCIKPFINKLPDNYKQALLITEFQHISQKELAEKLNISYSGAKSRVQRGKEKLKELILNCCAYQNDKYGNLIDTEDRNCGYS